jgi:hypothetical protein
MSTKRRHRRRKKGALVEGVPMALGAGSGVTIPEKSVFH